MTEFLVILIPVVIFVVLIMLIMVPGSITVFGKGALIFAIPVSLYLIFCLIKLTLALGSETKFKV